jgi:hypothetical protein
MHGNGLGKGHAIHSFHPKKVGAVRRYRRGRARTSRTRVRVIRPAGPVIRR